MPEDIRIIQLSKSYHEKKVLKELSFHIKFGAITALMAPSGGRENYFASDTDGAGGGGFRFC